MSKKNNAISKSSSHFDNYASGIKFNYKNRNKQTRNEFFNDNKYSCEIEIEEKPELNRRHINGSEFKPSTKQTIDQNEYKRFKKKYDIEEIDEKEEDEQVKEEKNSTNKKGSETPPSRVRKNIYTEKNTKKNNKIILDEEEEEEIKNEEIQNISSEENKEDKEDEEEEGNKNNNVYNNKQSKGIKSEGGIHPSLECFHRLKASNPLISPVL